MERPDIISTGTICAVRKPRHVYDVRMKSGYVAVAVIPKKGPHPDESLTEDDLIGAEVKVAFSAVDMSRCKVREWL